jgi:hypothetical protein
MGFTFFHPPGNFCFACSSDTAGRDEKSSNQAIFQGDDGSYFVGVSVLVY